VSSLTFNLNDGSVRFQLPLDAVRDLKQALSQLMSSLQQATVRPEGGSKPAPLRPMEYQYRGDVFLEIFCNPNIWPNPFAARVLVTLKDEQIRLSIEADLSQMIEDVNQALEQNV
jgi:hypothetical protein